MTDTIFALSSGAPPAGIAVIRISGTGARGALDILGCGEMPARRPVLRRLVDRQGDILDEALVLWIPGPGTATGEDLAELHCHGGRAVVAAVLDTLGQLTGLREANPGEFTRRALANGRIDLAEAEGLADLLSAETEWQRRGALHAAGGELSRRVEGWRDRVLQLSAQLEAVIDFSDEDDVGDLPPSFAAGLEELRRDIERVLERPSADRLREGVRVVFGGPPNAGKSSLFNAIIEDGAAIVSAEAGTTRDVIERAVALGSVPLVFVDTAGLRAEDVGEIEAIGIERAHDQLRRAEIVLWLGGDEDRPEGAIQVWPKIDLADTAAASSGFRVSALTGEGVDALVAEIIARAKRSLPPPDRITLTRRQKLIVREACEALLACRGQGDWLIAAENLRRARVSFDEITGRNSTEEMLDVLFGRFCIGK
ncbi:tRNA uridine-5-carboxymethylaminomethyl(34) synthesis GTPase MnmE [Qipengyuania soli]|uniref:tRNA modification GTPase MnmE n=1 Tax=Qipengyuania soli TaxID=2782568 RepID=A0A7S8F417_9SPHN|nr:tRNA uridine-5-carboxymethylaminomethyl(34) synthesis GTPase MnmE [Qipengyuania soli]QPC98695.1 tRNA uridine-5-carboxymethylaminomethyl(34) synthesis GTPase MnmE [Qipengyuania soli]